MTAAEATTRDSPTPLQSLLRHWVSTTILIATGLAAGLAVALMSPVTYRAQERVAVVPSSTSAYALPGYPLGARELASDYARWIQNTIGTGDTPGAANGGVSASPVPDTSVILVEAEATSPDAAITAAAGASSSLRRAVSQAVQARSPEQAYKAFKTLQPKVAAAQTAADSAQAAYSSAVGAKASSAIVRQRSAALQSARIALAEVQLQQSANGDLYRQLYANTQANSQLKVVASASSAGNNRTSQLARWGLVGLGLGYVIAQVAAVTRDRRGTRRSR